MGCYLKWYVILLLNAYLVETVHNFGKDPKQYSRPEMGKQILLAPRHQSLIRYFRSFQSVHFFPVLETITRGVAFSCIGGPNWRNAGFTMSFYTIESLQCHRRGGGSLYGNSYGCLNSLMMRGSQSEESVLKWLRAKTGFLGQQTERGAELALG